MRIRFVFFVLLVCVPFVMGQTVDRPLSLGGDVQAPKVIHQVEPKFPRPFFSKPKGGEVLVHLVVDTSGLPQDITVKRTTNDKLNNAALKAVREYRFEPARKAGVAVAVELNIAINFQVF